MCKIAHKFIQGKCKFDCNLKELYNKMLKYTERGSRNGHRKSKKVFRKIRN